MGTSGDAAEQVVRMSLEGMEAVAKISGKVNETESGQESCSAGQSIRFLLTA